MAQEIVELPEDILAYAARMFLPADTGLDIHRMCLEAIDRTRDHEALAKFFGLTLEKAKARANDPMYIAHYVMMFVHPQMASNVKYHEWHGRLLRLRKERGVSW